MTVGGNGDATVDGSGSRTTIATGPPSRISISVFLADDSVLVREGVRALIDLEGDIDVVGVAGDLDELMDGVTRTRPQVIVTDIRMPPTFRREGIDAARLLRKQLPGTGVVVLSQFDDPEYAVSLLAEGAAGYAYLLKDRVAEGDQLVRAIREVATGGSMLDPRIVEALTAPVTDDALLSVPEQQLLDMIAAGTPIKAIAVAFRTTPTEVDARIEALFRHLADAMTRGNADALERLRRLQRVIAEREEQGEVLSRLLPTGLADKLRRDGRHSGTTEELDATILMADVRGYSAIAERTDPTTLAAQLNGHRAEMNRAVVDHGGTVMQFVGDAVMAVFGAVEPASDHADRAVATAQAMHAGQARVNESWAAEGREPFDLGIGISTGRVAAALLGSDEHMEYSVVGDAVNLTQRLQQWAERGETVLSEATVASVTRLPECDVLPPAAVKGRTGRIGAHRFPPRSP